MKINKLLILEELVLKKNATSDEKHRDQANRGFNSTFLGLGGGVAAAHGIGNYRSTDNNIIDQVADDEDDLAMIGGAIIATGAGLGATLGYKATPRIEKTIDDAFRRKSIYEKRNENK